MEQEGLRMNFVNMPELRWHYGNPFTIGLMLAGVTLLFVAFRKSGWL